MARADFFRSDHLKGRLLRWFRRGLDVIVIGAVGLALIETVSFLSGMSRGLLG